MEITRLRPQRGQSLVLTVEFWENYQLRVHFGRKTSVVQCFSTDEQQMVYEMLERRFEALVAEPFDVFRPPA